MDGGGGRLALSLVGAVVATGLAVSSASATFPGKNGKIVYSEFDGVSSSDIHIVKPNGNGNRALTTDASDDDAPALSPNGTKVAFVRYGTTTTAIWVMRSNGRNVHPVSTGAAASARRLRGGTGDLAPQFSPDGRKIVFVRRTAGVGDIWIMRADGTRQRPLTESSGSDFDPSFAASGKFIVFESDRDGDNEIFRMRKNGEGERQLTDNDVADYDPAVSPNSRRILFLRNGPEGGIWRMSKAGLGQSRLFSAPTANANTYTTFNPSPSPNGKRIAFGTFDSAIAPNRELVTINRHGEDLRLIPGTGQAFGPDWGVKPPKKKRHGQRH